MPDWFAGHNAGLDSPAGDGFAVVPDNSSDLAKATRAIYVGATGDIKADLVGGATLTFTSVPQGSILPIRARRIYTTGTTASALVGLL